jgi:SAM-dependent methyltransferase
LSALRAPAFDAVAGEYDRAFTDTRLGRWLRAQVWNQLARHFPPGTRVLELGCGTGEDATWLAGRGVRVTATDASPAMLEVARRKAEAAGASDRVDFALLDLASGDLANAALPNAALPGVAPATGGRPRAGFDGAFSNFGALNCLERLDGLAARLADATRPGARVVLVVMGRWCLWELGWFLAHGDVRTALRRLHRHGVTAHVGGEPVQVWYHPPGQVRRAFAPWFRPLGLQGVGVLLPPSFLAPWVERHATAARLLRMAEGFLAAAWPFRLLGDHYLVALERRG